MVDVDMTTSHIETDPDRAAILARRQRFIALALGGLATGCAVEQRGSEEGITTTTASTSTTGTQGSETGDTGDMMEESSTRPQPCLSPDLPDPPDCDILLQDCPEGEKCVPYDAGVFSNDRRCVPVQGAGAAGEPCTWDGPVDATDDCDADSVCSTLREVDGVWTGVCAAFCEGTMAEPECDAGSACLFANLGQIAMCFDACDPLMQDCDEGLGCAWTGDDFVCLISYAEDTPGEACDFINECQPGSLCLAGVAVPGCTDGGCCAEYCALDDVDACADPQLECTAFFAEGQAPMGQEQLGVCVAPGACEGGEPGCLEHPIEPRLNGW